MRTHSPQEITQLLVAWGDGDESALEDLTPLVYEELHRLAHHYMGRERAHVNALSLTTPLLFVALTGTPLVVEGGAVDHQSARATTALLSSERQALRPASFNNPDHVSIVIHNYRWRLSLAPGAKLPIQRHYLL